MSMVMKEEFALFDQAKHAISVKTLISQSACSATRNTHAPNVPVWTRLRRQETEGRRIKRMNCINSPFFIKIPFRSAVSWISTLLSTALSTCLCSTPPFPSQNRPQRRLFKLTRVPRCTRQHALGSHGRDEVIMAESNQTRTRNFSPCRRLTVTPSKSLFPRYVAYFHCVFAR